MKDEEMRSRHWWRETQVLWLVAFVGGIYFTRIADLNLLGEETRRAQVAAEMLWSGNWLVPKQQGQIYLSRPPLGSWVIAAVASVRGSLDAVTIRLPSLCAVLLTTLLIYGYARNFLSRRGAFLAAVAYPTMAQVLQLGRLAESEGLFTFFISASLLVWHWGYLQKWPAAVMWSAGYFLAALAGLTKGPQGIVYFVGPVWFYLLIVERDWRMLFKPAHAVGLLCGVGALAAWQVPYVMATSWEAGKAVWLKQASNRFTYLEWPGVIKHFLWFPVEILACTFPWSLAFIQIFNRQCWRAVANVRAEVRFLLVALAITFPTVWFAPYARGRYFMPLYPLIGILCGLILDRCASGPLSTWLNNGWRQFLGGLTTAAVVGGIVVCVLAVRPDLVSQDIQLSLPLGAAFLALALGAAVWMIRHDRSTDDRIIQISTGCLVVVLGTAYNGLLISSQVARQPRVDYLLADVHAELPPGETLVSFGRVSHAFAYYYGEFIPQQNWPDAGGDGTLPRYFCFRKTDLATHPLPFAWEPIAEMSFEDDDVPSATSYTVIARRLPTVASAEAAVAN